MRKLIFTYTLTILLTAPALASLITGDVNQLAVYSGRNLSFSREVQVTGSIGSSGNTWLDRNVQISGPAYSGGGFSTGREVTLGGSVYANGDVWMDRNTATMDVYSTQAIQLGRDVSVTGNLVAGGYVGIDRDGSISGDVSYGSNQWVHSSTQVGGQVAKNLYSSDTWQFDMMSNPGFSSGNQSLYYGRDETTSLNPGSYSSLTASRGTTIYLTAGTYDFKSIWFDRDVQVIADTSGGDVILNVSSSFSTSSGVSVAGQGSGALSIFTEGSASLGSNNYLGARLVSFSSINVEADSRIEGQLFASRDVWLGSNTNVVFSGVGAGGPAVPEPAALFLMACSIPFLRRRPQSQRD